MNHMITGYWTCFKCFQRWPTYEPMCRCCHPTQKRLARLPVAAK